MQLEEIKALIEKTSPDGFANYLRQKYPMPKKTRSIVICPGEEMRRCMYETGDMFLLDVAEKYFNAIYWDKTNRKNYCSDLHSRFPVIRLNKEYTKLTFSIREVIHKPTTKTVIYLTEELKNYTLRSNFLKKVFEKQEADLNAT